MTDEHNPIYVKDKIEDMMFLFWESIPEPKEDYVQWWYGSRCRHELLNKLGVEDGRKHSVNTD